MKVCRIAWLVTCVAAGLWGATVALVTGQLGVHALAVAVLLLAVSPYLWSAYVRVLTSVPVSMAAGLGAWVPPPVPVNPQQEQVPHAPEIRPLTDGRLRAAWRTSFLALQRRPPASQAVVTVEERQRYLDEFERRNPSGFRAWLLSEAWASNIPVRYLRESHTPASDINWDELTRQQDC